MWRFLSRWSESRLVAAVSLCTCVRVSPTPAGADWAAVHTVSCVQEHPTVIMCTRLCNIYTGVIIGRKTQHCIKILSASLLCTKLLLDIILLNNKFVKYIFFNHMRFLGCAKRVAPRLEAQAGETQAGFWVPPARGEQNTPLQQFFICLWRIVVDCSCEYVWRFLRCVVVGREAAGIHESLTPHPHMEAGNLVFSVGWFFGSAFQFWIEATRGSEGGRCVKLFVSVLLMCWCSFLQCPLPPHRVQEG